jgi:peroxiredoxin
MKPFLGGSAMNKVYPLIAALGAAVVVSLCLAGDDAAPKGAQIGQPVPQFVLQDQDGNSVNLATYSGKLVVLEWTNPDCPFVQAHYEKHTMTDLAAKYKPQGIAWLAINSSHDVTNSFDKQWATQQNISYPILNDAAGSIGHAYGATNTPDMFIISKDGKLIYKGAIDNDRDQDRTSGKINYVDQALSETLAGKPVSVPVTTPYGCTVKYAE